MSDAVDALILDLLEWVSNSERSYAEVMEAWRTSCPRLPVWEDAVDRGLIAREHANGRSIVRITSSGRALLLSRRKPSRESGEAAEVAE
jgi:D-3-phosphoglycerate dehydrogenase